MSDIRSSYTDDINFYRGWSARSLAERYGTPLYVYSEAVLRARCRELMALCPVDGFGVNYSVKANTNPAILAICREEGLTVDAMSPGELYMDELAGFGPDKILYISNNIDPEEMKNAIAHHLTVSVDSLAQLELYGALNPGGDVMIRINPGIGEGHSDKVITAGKETKFAISPDRLVEAFALLKKHTIALPSMIAGCWSLIVPYGVWYISLSIKSTIHPRESQNSCKASFVIHSVPCFGVTANLIALSMLSILRVIFISQSPRRMHARQARLQ